MAKNTHTRKNVIKNNYSFTPIKEIAIRNELPLREVREAYKHCRSIVLKETIDNIKHGKININYFQTMDRVFTLTEEYLDNKRLKDIDEQEKLFQLNAFSLEKGLSFSNVKDIYSRFSSRLSSGFEKNKLEELIHYNPKLGNEAVNLTKKYFGIQALNKLNFK